MEIDLDLNNLSHLDDLNELLLKKISECKRIKFAKVKNDNKELLDFLSNSYPDEVLNFAFNSWYSGEMINGSYYMSGLLNAAKKTTKEVYIHYSSFTHEELESLLKACSQVDKFTISNSKLDLNSKFDLSGAKFTMQHISFRWCGKNHSNNWASKPIRFENLIQAFSKCSLQYSLKTINIYNCGISNESASQILSKYSLSNIQLISEDNWLLTD